MGDAKSIKERGILEQVIKSELDFITYVDVHTGTFHVIVTNDDTDVTPPPEGDYTQVNAHQNHRVTVILLIRNMQFFSAVYLPAQQAVRNNQIIPLFQFRENMRQF